jgi:hypothetical protein
VRVATVQHDAKAAREQLLREVGPDAVPGARDERVRLCAVVVAGEAGGSGIEAEK